MREEKKLAVSRLVLATREHPIVIGVRDKGFLLSTLRPADEVNDQRRVFADIEEGKVEAEMLGLAKQLVEAALMTMIREKLKGHKPIIAAAPERGNVINLMDALKASLGQSKPPAKSKSKAEVEAPPVKVAAAGGRKAAGKGKK